MTCLAIYAGATVLRRLTVGKGASTGGNVWLTRSVPAGSSITHAKGAANLRRRRRHMNMTLESRAKGAWRAAREALARLNRLLAETGNSDDDLVFHIRRETEDRPSTNTARSAIDSREPSV